MSKKVTDFKLNQDIEKYKKMGLDERTSIIVACSVNGVPEKATEILSELGDEQAELRKCLNEMIEFSKLLLNEETNISNDIIKDVKNEEPNIECKFGEQC
jgi:hypothetical protein